MVGQKVIHCVHCPHPFTLFQEPTFPRPLLSSSAHFSSPSSVVFCPHFLPFFVVFCPHFLALFCRLLLTFPRTLLSPSLLVSCSDCGDWLRRRHCVTSAQLPCLHSCGLRSYGRYQRHLLRRTTYYGATVYYSSYGLLCLLQGAAHEVIRPVAGAYSVATAVVTVFSRLSAVCCLSKW